MEVVKPIIDALHRDTCSVRYIVWSMGPDIFFADQRSKVRGWVCNDVTAARMKGSGKFSSMYAYYRPKPLYAQPRRGPARQQPSRAVPNRKHRLFMIQHKHMELCARS